MDSYNLGGNAFFLAIHATLLVPQAFLGLWYKTWGFSFGMVVGHVLEILGYLARVQMHFGHDKFLMYIVTLTIGPAFFSAAIYLCLARIIAVYGHHLSRFKPRTYTITFMISDLVALVLQALGGGILGRNNVTQDQLNLGLAIIKAGLGFHVAAISIFVLLAAEFGVRTYRKREEWNPRFAGLQESKRFKSFLIGLTVATFCILIRTSFRVAELQDGLHSKLADNETDFMVLEGAMVALAALCLAFFHPGVSFQGRWGEADFHIHSKKDIKSEDYPMQLNSM